MSRNQIIERERRWQIPVAVTAIAAAVLGFAGGIVQVGALDGAETDAASLLARDANDGSFAAATVLQAASWFFLAVPFAYLFLAAAARSERVNKVLVGLFVIAPILLAVGSALQWQGYADVADTFVEQRPGLEAEAAQAEQEEAAGGGKAESGQGQARGDEPGSADQPGGGGGGGAGGAADEAPADEEEDDADPVEDRAEQLIEDSSQLQTAGSIFLGGLFGIAVGILYTCLQAMRVGLVTRFFGSLGMALAVAMIIFLGGLLPAMLLFTVALGFLILGRWPGGKPRAWEAGRAIPWPRPGEQPADSGTIEGRGEEVEPEEAPGKPESGPAPPSGPRRKRKRRG